jgi:hypothetical protein
VPLPIDLLIVAAIAVFVVPGVFLVLVALAGIRRSRGGQLGPSWAPVLVFVGGLSLGTLLLFASELVLAAPILAAIGVLALRSWRARRRRQAGWLILGAGLPTVLVWALALASGAPAAIALPLLGAGAIPALLGLALIARRDPPAPAPSIAAPAGQPGSRSIGTIATAIRDPSFIGPFGMPEIGMLVGFVATWLIVPFAIPDDAPWIVHVAIPSILGALVGTEAYIRFTSTRSRRAFEAFSWLGESEVARARKATDGASLPGTLDAAVRWLASRPERPERPEELPIRIGILLLAERADEARRLLARLPSGTPTERFELAALRDLVDWRSGGDGDLAGMEEAAVDIQPGDSDDRLRAEVTIAVARVRRLMADGRATPGDAVEPFLEVRQKLGRRADGQMGRALRPRIIPGLIVSGIVLGVASQVLGGVF